VAATLTPNPALARDTLVRVPTDAGQSVLAALECGATQGKRARLRTARLRLPQRPQWARLARSGYGVLSVWTSAMPASRFGPWQIRHCSF